MSGRVSWLRFDGRSDDGGEMGEDRGHAGADVEVEVEALR